MTTKTAPDKAALPEHKVTRHNARERDLKLILTLREGVTLYKRGELAGLPRVAHPKQKQECSESLELFAKTYLPHVFSLPMSDGQKSDLATMQRSIMHGEKYCFASPRGDGKTSRVEAAILWAMLYGHKKCMVIVGADLTAAQEISDSIKLELRINERLRADFPIPCWAATIADDTALKAKGLHWDGKNLGFGWDKHKIVLPVMDRADGSGCVLVPRGLTGRLRGMRLKVGKNTVRPDFYAVDDGQTDESAASPAQVDTRESLILGAIAGSAGPGESISVVMPCTVIRHNDLAARFLDRKRHPDWHGCSRGLIRAWPKAQKTLWKEYHRLRKAVSPEDADKFYAANRVEMDAGAIVDWEERYIRGKELSALQHAENLLCDVGDAVFNAEYMNDPTERNPSVYELTAKLVASRVHPKRGIFSIPDNGKSIIVATDINYYGLHSAAIAFSNDQTGWIAWYGRHDSNGSPIVPKLCPEPEAKRLMFEALVIHGRQIADLPFTRNGQRVRPDLWVIDAGYMADVVRQYINGPARSLGIPVIASHGFSADHYRPTAKSVIGKPREMCHVAETQRSGRFLAFCSCYWREVSQRGWLASPNAPSSLSLFDGSVHTDFSEQVTRERLVEKLHGDHGTHWRWHTAPGWHDYGDAVTMCYAGAAFSGIGTVDAGPVVKQPRRRRRRVTHIAVR